MSKRRIGESSAGDVLVYVNEQADVAIVTMPVREAVMLMALAGLCGGAGKPRPDAYFEAMSQTFEDNSNAHSGDLDLYAKCGFAEPKPNEYGVIVFGEVFG